MLKKKINQNNFKTPPEIINETKENKYEEKKNMKDITLLRNHLRQQSEKNSI